MLSVRRRHPNVQRGVSLWPILNACSCDTDPVEIRRSKALGILAQPAQALQLLYQHQNDTWNGPEEPADLADPDEEPDQPSAEVVGDQQPMSDTAGDAHRSLQIVSPPFDPERARPRAVEDVGTVLLGRLRTVRGDRCRISVKPVIDLPAGHTPVDGYEIPARLREQLQLRYPADVFPYAVGVSRRMDIDHTIPYLSPDEVGPPGQTRIGNLGPHVRRNHRVKTHGGWQVRQPEPGIWLWRSPHRRIYIVNATGTHPLGDTKFAELIWHAAANPPQRSSTTSTLTLLR